MIWGLWHQKQVSQAGISNYILQKTAGYNYMSLPEIPGGRLNKKDGLTRYGNSHVKDKTS